MEKGYGDKRASYPVGLELKSAVLPFWFKRSGRWMGCSGQTAKFTHRLKIASIEVKWKGEEKIISGLPQLVNEGER